ncbi:hypothetical protein BOTBODRAFT_46694 [Botryobasidium botryosum FD-172 SS1]|uniref:Uncharacterized protein n=1 Tax=Botryobasidium botryosum (strain FD-172 SS1) TaxID=930990 RepID=A0A067M5Z7_BOTB1|nr:hypothetical protein BOTBODRAFT_46694 [Botryobasidium botryosum FD-172 SS1]
MNEDKRRQGEVTGLSILVQKGCVEPRVLTARRGANAGTSGGREVECLSLKLDALNLELEVVDIDSWLLRVRLEAGYKRLIAASYAVFLSLALLPRAIYPWIQTTRRRLSRINCATALNKFNSNVLPFPYAIAAVCNLITNYGRTQVARAPSALIRSDVQAAWSNRDVTPRPEEPAESQNTSATTARKASTNKGKGKEKGKPRQSYNADDDEQPPPLKKSSKSTSVGDGPAPPKPRPRPRPPARNAPADPVSPPPPPMPPKSRPLPQPPARKPPANAASRTTSAASAHPTIVLETDDSDDNTRRPRPPATGSASRTAASASRASDPRTTSAPPAPRNAPDASAPGKSGSFNKGPKGASASALSSRVQNGSPEEEVGKGGSIAEEEVIAVDLAASDDGIDVAPPRKRKQKGAAPKKAPGARVHRPVTFSSPDAEKWLRARLDGFYLRVKTADQNAKAWWQDTVLPKFFDLWPLDPQWDEDEEIYRYYRWALRESRNKPVTKLDKARTPLVFPNKISVAYARPKKASAKRIFALEHLELIADYTDQAKESLIAEGRSDIACRVYQAAVDMAWDELDAEYQNYYGSEAGRRRNEPENVEDKEGFLALLQATAQVWLWSTQMRCPDGWAFSLMACGPVEDGELDSWVVDMPPLGASCDFGKLKTEDFDWDDWVGTPWVDYNLAAREQRKKDCVGEYADSKSEIECMRPRINISDDMDSKSMIRELKRYIRDLYVYSRTEAMASAQEKLDWDDFIQHPDSYLTASSIPDTIKWGPLEEMRPVHVAMLCGHIEASDSDENPFFGFTFENAGAGADGDDGDAAAGEDEEAVDEGSQAGVIEDDGSDIEPAEVAAEPEDTPAASTAKPKAGRAKVTANNKGKAGSAKRRAETEPEGGEEGPRSGKLYPQNPPPARPSLKDGHRAPPNRPSRQRRKTPMGRWKTSKRTPPLRPPAAAKNAIAAAQKDINEQADPAPAPKHQGRPPAAAKRAITAAQEDVGAQAEDEQAGPVPAPKRRGRPPAAAKNAIAAAQKDVDEGAEGEQADPTPAPKRRGRPPAAAKKAIAAAQKDVDAQPAPPAKRPPGRPPAGAKKGSSVVQGDVDGHGDVDEQPDEDAPAPKRQRPPAGAKKPGEAAKGSHALGEEEEEADGEAEAEAEAAPSKLSSTGRAIKAPVPFDPSLPPKPKPKAKKKN